MPSRGHPKQQGRRRPSVGACQCLIPGKGTDEPIRSRPIPQVIFGLIYPFVVARFVWPLHVPLPAKVAAAAVLFVASQYLEWCRLSSGSRFSPEFPRVVIVLFNWAFGALLFLALLQFLLDAGLLVAVLLHLTELHVSRLFPAAWARAAGRPVRDLAALVEAAPRGVSIVLLDHQPREARTAARLGVALQLSGHTHGGLIVGVDRLAAGPNGGFVSGCYDVDGMTLYVSNGTALWPGFALRLGRPSELTRITLRRGDTA